MTKEKKNNYIKYLPYVLIPTVGIILAKVIMHTGILKNALKDSLREQETLDSIRIYAEPTKNRLNLYVRNKSFRAFKDMDVECTFIASSGYVLGESEYTIHDYFPKRSTKMINDFFVSDIPLQTTKVICDVKNINIIKPGK